MTDKPYDTVNGLISSHDETAFNTARYITERKESAVYGLRSYLGTLDNTLDPVMPGDFAIGYGRPGHNKTTWSMAWMDAHDKAQPPSSDELSVYFTSETLIEAAMMYLISIDTGISRSKIKRGQLTDEQMIQVVGEKKSGAGGYAARYAARNIYFVGKAFYSTERRQPNLSPAYIERAIWAIEDWTKKKVRSVWIDYLNRLDMSAYEKGGRSTTYVYGDALDHLKNITQSNKLQTVLLTQAKQEVDHRDDPMPTDADVKDTNAALEMADFMFGFMRPIKYNGIKSALNPGADYHGCVIGRGGDGKYNAKVHEYTACFRVNKQKDGPVGVDHFFWMDPATARIIHPDPYAPPE